MGVENLVDLRLANRELEVPGALVQRAGLENRAVFWAGNFRVFLVLRLGETNCAHPLATSASESILYNVKHC